MKALYLGLAFLLCVSASQAYKDVVFIHGIFAGPSEFDYFTGLIQQHHSGTRVTSVDLYDYMDSLIPLWDQAEKMAAVLRPILTNSSSEGTVLIAFSQGGIVSRGILSLLEHNVKTFIALSCPLAGQFGDTEFLKYLFPKYIKENIFKLFYTMGGQQFSVGNYWIDPHQMDLYRRYSAYLAVINNETTAENHRSEEFRSNFLRLKNLVLIGGPDDGVITPWQSSHFGVYNDNETVQSMTAQEWYHNDAFGLRTLDKAGAVHTYTQPGIEHIFWHTKKLVFDKYILPWL